LRPGPAPRGAATGQHRAAHIDGKHLVPFVDRHLQDRPVGEDAVRVDQDVERAALFQQALDILLDRYVTVDGGWGDAAFFLQGSRGLRQRALVAVRKDQTAAFPHDRGRNGAPESAGAAGHQCGSILQHSVAPSVQA
jgi:hypothetical protein